MQADGSLRWADTDEPITAPVGVPTGARLILTTPNGHHEITGVEMGRPSLNIPVGTRASRRWRVAMFKRRESIERRLPGAWANLQDDIEARGGEASTMALARVDKLEDEARAYNEMARELHLPILRVEVPDWAQE